MKFSIGDKVILRQTSDEGIVVDFIGKDMVEVEVNGTHFPVYIDEIDHPYLKWFTEKNKQKKKSSPPEQLPVEKEKHRPQRLAKGIYLSFMPVFKADEMEDVVSQLKIYLINELAVSIRFSYDVKFFNQSDFKHEGTLHAFGHIYLHTVDYADMNDQPRFHWRLSDAANLDYKTEEGILRIKPAKLFDHINDLLLKNEPTFSYLLVEDFILKPKEEIKFPQVKKKMEQSVYSAKPAKITSLADLPRYEVDLHIEQLMDNCKNLSNSEIIDIQLKTLHKYLNLAIMHRQERMIIIHGLGSGILKDAVHKILKETPHIESYRNEWMGKYGFGATEVIFNRF